MKAKAAFYFLILCRQLLSLERYRRYCPKSFFFQTDKSDVVQKRRFILDLFGNAQISASTVLEYSWFVINSCQGVTYVVFVTKKWRSTYRLQPLENSLYRLVSARRQCRQIILKCSRQMLWHLYDIIIHGSTWAKPSKATPPARCLYNPRTSYWEPLQAAVRSPTE